MNNLELIERRKQDIDEVRTAILSRSEPISENDLHTMNIWKTLESYESQTIAQYRNLIHFYQSLYEPKTGDSQNQASQ